MKSFLSILTAITLLISGFRATATIYYVASSGSDNNSGMSTSSPWKTLAKVSSYTGFAAGDQILFNRGDVFYGSLTVNNSGNSGSPITFGAYGSGADPVITGFTTISGWTYLGSNIWESSSAASTLSTCNVVLVNGVNTPMGRYPNSGYLPYQSHSGTSSITSSSLSGSPNWTGAELVMRPIRWILERDPITAQSGGRLTYSGSSNTPTDGFGFFIQNDARTLDSTNEWYFNPSTKKLRIFSYSTPSGVQVPTIDRLVYVNGNNYITFDHLDFVGANTTLFENRNSKYITIQYCGLRFSGCYGAYINNQVSQNEIMTINGCTFDNNVENAMNFLGYSSKLWIENNTITNSGMIPGAGTNSQYDYDAIVINGANSIVEYNTISNSGHMAVSMRHSDGIIVRYNYITYFGMTKYDAGAIYSWNGDTTTVKSRVIDHNIIQYCNQNRDGIGTATPLLFAIYLDADSKNTSITNNTVANCPNADAIHILNTGTVTITGNVCYNNLNQCALLHAWNFGMEITGLTIKNNTFVSRTSDQTTLSFRDDDNNLFNKFGVADYNCYAKPIDESSSVQTIVQYSPTNRTLSSWQSFSGQDAHSKKSPKTTTNVNDLLFEYNASTSSKTISLPAAYEDMSGTSYNGSITLAPYTSAVLIKTGSSSNSVPVANAGSDQSITLPSSTVTLSGSGTDSNGSITSYAWSEVSGPSTGTITNSSSASTTVTGLVAGVYQFQLKVTDNSGATATSTVQITVLAQAASLTAAGTGLNYSYYEASSFTTVPSFSSLTAVKTGTVPNFDISVANRSDNFAFYFYGYILISTSGQYTFYTISDDGSKLFIDNSLVVNNDGVHPATEQSGSIYLSAGMHYIAVGFFEHTGGQVLSVSYTGPGIGREVIPNSVLFTSNATGSLLSATNQNENIYQPGQASSDLTVNAYPNPFIDVINVNISGAAGTFNLSILNSSGMILKNETGSKGSGTIQKSLNTSLLPRGVYFLRLIQNNKSSVVKLVK